MTSPISVLGRHDSLLKGISSVGIGPAQEQNRSHDEFVIRSKLLDDGASLIADAQGTASQSTHALSVETVQQT
jgi:hypothetical protein